MEKTLNKLLRKIDYTLVKRATFQKLKESHSFEIFLKSLSSLEKADLTQTIRFLSESKSQLKQDLFVLNCLGFKKNGYFVEFGATNGIDLSNSWLLEKHFGWQGVLAEPAKIWHHDLNKNRQSYICHECVWSNTGDTLEFNEVSGSEFSTISQYSDSDHHASIRNQGKKYSVQTISLRDLLKKCNAPYDIDYLSVDTEGSEFEILEKFDFSEFKIKIITVEHNYTPIREKLHVLLVQKGYKRIFTELSLWDDWYVLESEIKLLQ